MNGESTELYDKIMERFDKNDEKQDKRHEDNLKTFGKLPCKLHAFMIGALWTIFGAGLLTAVVVILVKKAMAS